MSIADLVRRMAAAGAPPEAIAIAVEAVEAAEERRKAPARERKQRQRDRARDEAVIVEGQSRDECVTVTGQGRDTPSPSPSSSPDPSNNPTPAPENNNSRARGSRLAANFSLPTDWRDWAMDERDWTKAEADAEGQAFADFWHAKAGRDAVKLDWHATWRNWVRNSRRPPPTSFRRSTGYGPGHSGIPL